MEYCWNFGIENKDEEFWKYLREFDIINLTETWIELKNWKKAEKWLPKEFMWEIQGAYKDKKKGQKCRRNDNRNQKNIESKEC